MRKALFIMFLMSLMTSKIQGQTIMENLTVSTNENLQLTDSIYTVVNFTLNENSTLTFKENISSVKINCKNFTVSNNAKIIGIGKNGSNGKNGKENSKDATKGISGKNGVNIIITCDTFSFCDFTVNLSGGYGGNGGNGFKGEKGKRAHCCTHDGKNGKRGGHGGNGGHGGEAGVFRITYKNLVSPCNTTINSENFILNGGIGGIGGKSGQGGDGGNKADECFPGCNRKGGKKGPSGNKGVNGTTQDNKIPQIIMQ